MMTASESNPSSEVSRAQVFLTTHWSVVLAAARNDSTRAQAALDHLCRQYWYPIYHFVRRQGHSMHDAQDLTQEFFARLLEKNWITHAVQARGRFRSFLLLVLKRFLAVGWHKAYAQKRVGKHPGLALPLFGDVGRRGEGGGASPPRTVSPTAENRDRPDSGITSRRGG